MFKQNAIKCIDTMVKTLTPVKLLHVNSTEFYPHLSGKSWVNSHTLQVVSRSSPSTWSIGHSKSATSACSLPNQMHSDFLSQANPKILGGVSAERERYNFHIVRAEATGDISG